MRSTLTPSTLLAVAALFALPLRAGAQAPEDANANHAGSTPPPTTQAPPPAPAGTAGASAQVTAPASSAVPDPRRRDPAYFRGRTSGTEPEQGARWIPRVIFFPLHFVTEYLIRRPALALSEFAEVHHIARTVDRVLNPTPNFSWSPTFVGDLGLLVSGGVRFQWRNALVTNNSVSGSAATGGLEYWHASLRDQLILGPAHFGLWGDYLTRPDRPFYGLGPTSRSENRTNYTIMRADAMAQAGYWPSNHARFDLNAGYRYEHTGPGRPPSIETIFNPQALPAYGAFLHLFIGSVTLAFDTRVRREQSSGFQVTLRTTYGRDFEDSNRHWFAQELELDGAIEVMRPDRVLSASVYATVTHPLGSEPVPFTHQATLGYNRLPGFLYGRFVGESAAVFEVRYRYPVWERLDAVWLVSAGNVFGDWLADFRPQFLHGNVGVGVRTRGIGLDALQLLLALGTSRFDEPFGIEDVRVYVGVNPGL